MPSTRRQFLLDAARAVGGCLAPALLQPQGSRMDPETSSAILTSIDVPDAEITRIYEKAATQNVLAAVDNQVFFGYWSVCADREGFGRGCTYPSLDGHQMADALLRLGQVAVVRANWDYVRSFQKPDGRLPLAILPGVKSILGQAVDPNGGLYTHWVPGDPLRALAGPTYIQNADVLFCWTQDRAWLQAQMPSVRLAADYLASLMTPDGLVKGAGYYVEFPTRLEHDGVAQCHAADAFRRVSALCRVLGDGAAARRYAQLASRVSAAFLRHYWVEDHFAEYIHPEKGRVDKNGLTDTNWAAIATGVATAEQTAVLWPRLRNEAKFYYGGVPTGIATRPEAYEDWEFSLPGHRHDLAAMGRVWYLECGARARMADGEGIVSTLHQVSRIGRDNGYYWRERYHAPDGKAGGPNTYCEYPANLIRIVQRFLFGVELLRNGAVSITPCVPPDFWKAGFRQTLAWRDLRLSYHMDGSGMEGTYSGQSPLSLLVRGRRPVTSERLRAEIRGCPATASVKDGLAVLRLPAAESPCRVRVRW
jgi:hypothetical protein